MKRFTNLISHLNGNRRSGITIIEVLASLTVAVIGLFGVLALIPFAVRQSELGLANNEASRLGQNMAEEFLIRGFNRVIDGEGDLPWSGAIVTTQLVNGEVLVAGVAAEEFGPANIRTAPPQPANASFTRFGTQIVHLDPMVVSNSTRPLPSEVAQPQQPVANPDILGKFLPNNLKFPVMNLLNQAGDPLSPIEAQLLAQSPDNLVFGRSNFFNEEVSDVEGPQPLLDASGGGNPVRRQLQGDVSWSAVMVPQLGANIQSSSSVDAASSYRMYTLVYSGRVPFESTDSDMVAGLVQRSMTYDIHNDPMNPNPQGVNGGFVENVNRIVLDPTAPIPEVFRDDWVMLINRRPTAGTVLSLNNGQGEQVVATSALSGFDVQVAFCRVISLGEFSVGNGPVRPTLTVEGGPFDFYFENDAMMNATATDTFMVHLKDVINVFERTVLIR